MLSKYQAAPNRATVPEAVGSRLRAAVDLRVGGDAPLVLVEKVEVWPPARNRTSKVLLGLSHISMS